MAASSSAGPSATKPYVPEFWGVVDDKPYYDGGAYFRWRSPEEQKAAEQKFTDSLLNDRWLETVPYEHVFGLEAQDSTVAKLQEALDKNDHRRPYLERMLSDEFPTGLRRVLLRTSWTAIEKLGIAEEVLNKPVDEYQLHPSLIQDLAREQEMLDWMKATGTEKFPLGVVGYSPPPIKAESRAETVIEKDRIDSSPPGTPSTSHAEK